MCPFIWEMMIESMHDYVQTRLEGDVEGNWRQMERKETKKQEQAGPCFSPLCKKHSFENKKKDPS